MTRTPIVAAMAAFVALSAAAQAEVEFLTRPDSIFAERKLPFSEAVRAGDTLWLAGQVGVMPGTLELIPGGIEAETRQTMENLGAVLEANGASFADVVKCTLMLVDIAEWQQASDVYRSFFEEGRFPARSAFGASGLALGARVEIECMAHVGD